jgi:DNA ligase (NAD+)
MGLHYGTWDEFVEAMTRAQIDQGRAWDDIMSIDGVGAVMATSVITTFQQDAERA